MLINLYCTAVLSLLCLEVHPTTALIMSLRNARLGCFYEASSPAIACSIKVSNSSMLVALNRLCWFIAQQIFGHAFVELINCSTIAWFYPSTSVPCSARCDSALGLLLSCSPLFQHLAVLILPGAFRLQQKSRMHAVFLKETVLVARKVVTGKVQLLENKYTWKRYMV